MKSDESPLFFDGVRITFSPSVAHMLGLNNALVLSQLGFLLKYYSRPTIDSDGYIWADYTYGYLLEKFFCFMGKSTLRRTIDGLKRLDLIRTKPYLVETYRQVYAKRGLCYSLNYEKIDRMTPKTYAAFCENLKSKTFAEAQAEVFADPRSVKLDTMSKLDTPCAHFGHSIQDGIREVLDNPYSPLSGDVCADETTPSLNLGEPTAKEPTKALDPSKQKIEAEIQEVVAAWNATGFPACLKLNAARRQSLQKRLSEPLFRDNWREVLAFMAASDFYRGGSDRGWVANIDYFIRESGFLKTCELWKAKSAPKAYVSEWKQGTPDLTANPPPGSESILHEPRPTE